MWYKNVGSSFFHCVTIHAFERQTDGQTDRKAIPCVALGYMQSYGRPTVLTLWFVTWRTNKLTYSAHELF